ncbi:MAG TPA: diguanylate cyclase, partial [Actinomycetota bacterium]
MDESTDRPRASPASKRGSTGVASQPLGAGTEAGLPTPSAESHGLALIASAHAAILSTDPAGIIMSWNPGSELLFGYGREEAIGMPISVLSPPGREADDKGTLEQALGGARVERHDTQRLRKGGTLIDVSLTMSRILDQADAIVGVSIVIFDNTERRATELKLMEDLTRLRRTFETSPFGMAVVDRSGRFVDVNPALCGLLQTPASRLMATTFQAVTHTEDLQTELAYVRQMLDGAIHSYHMEKRFIRQGGHSAWVKLSCSSLGVDQQEPDFLLFQTEDIEGQKLAEKRLLHQALHDPLTDLPNRTLLMDRLSQALARTARSHRDVAVMFVDLDRFKLINDSLGHDAGDQLIMAVGQRLARLVRPHDTLARLGGDEFVIVCEDLEGERAALALAERITRAVAEPINLDGSEVATTASIGIAVARTPDTRPPILLANADAAMYRAKDRGGGRWELFDEEMRSRLLTRLQTETSLRQALDRGEL